MALDGSLEQLARQISELGRDACIRELRALARPRLDFSDDYLAHLSLDRLCHILMAACIQARRSVPG